MSKKQDDNILEELSNANVEKFMKEILPLMILIKIYL